MLVVRVIKLATAVINVLIVANRVKNRKRSKGEKIVAGVMKRENIVKHGNVILIMIMIITTSPVEEAIGMIEITTTIEVVIMIAMMTMTAVTIQGAMDDVGQIQDKEMIIIMIIVAIPDVIDRHVIMDIVVEIVKANMVQRNLVNAIMIAVVVETAIEIMIVIIVNLREEKAHQDVRKRKNKMSQSDTCHVCVTMIVNMVVKLVNLIVVNIMYHLFLVLKMFILQEPIEVVVVKKILSHH
jgi:hypothetical protein